MPVQPKTSYPGVYVQEVPSGVRTIVGVSTAVAAFVGTAKRGPVNRAVRILGFADFERRFGGLDKDSEMSYAVRQFFLNGGTEAWIVRLAKNPQAAVRELDNAKNKTVLKLTARDEGKSGNDIEVRVDYDADNPLGRLTSTFNLTLNYESRDNPSDSIFEPFTNLSMNSNDARFVENLLEGSKLVTATVTVSQGDLANLPEGTSASGRLVDENGTLLDVSTLIDATHDQIRISVNGLEPIEVTLPPALTGTNAQKLGALCTAIKNKLKDAANGEPALDKFDCKLETDRVVMTSGAKGESSRVRVSGGSRDASARLKLGEGNGGEEVDGVEKIRPEQIPAPGSLTSGSLVAANLQPQALQGSHRFQISVDGYGPDVAEIDTDNLGPNFATRIRTLAERIQKAVSELRPTADSYKRFTCIITTGGDKLVLTSGGRGKGSQVIVTDVSGGNVASKLKLLQGMPDVKVIEGKNEYLTGGNEEGFKLTDAEAYGIFIASRSKRQGVFALEGVDLFNVLCLPGVADSGILKDADGYCRERRAFLIVDAPRSAKTPSEMGTTISGTALPKSDYAAVYYPWIEINDPLNPGKLRLSAPSGTMAGLYARIDGARGVWKAPAGTEATLRGVQGVDYLLTDGENGVLNPRGVNCLRVLPVFGAVSWGARTLRGDDQMASEYKYLSIRRTALFIEESLYRGLKWVVFEPNDEPLWAQIRLNVGAFMHNLFRQGAFQGKTPKEAYFVKVDKETTTETDRNLGIVNIWVGFAPLKPAEFVILYLQQMAGQTEV